MIFSVRLIQLFDLNVSRLALPSRRSSWSLCNSELFSTTTGSMLWTRTKLSFGGYSFLFVPNKNYSIFRLTNYDQSSDGMIVTVRLRCLFVALCCTVLPRRLHWSLRSRGGSNFFSSFLSCSYYVCSAHGNTMCEMLGTNRIRHENVLRLSHRRLKRWKKYRNRQQQQRNGNYRSQDHLEPERRSPRH